MGKKRHRKPAPGSFWKSLPPSLQAEFGISKLPLVASLSTSTRRSSASKAPTSLREVISTQPSDDGSGSDTPSAGDSAQVERTLVEQSSLPEVEKADPPMEVVDDREEDADEVSPPKKRRKLDSARPPGLLGHGKQQWDATGLVPHYRRKADFPEHLQKWFTRRRSLFSLYDKGCLLDDVGWYSVTPEKVADQIAERCRCDTILDAFCGVGGNAIAFARTCERVIALDNSPVRLALARHNAALYGVQDRIEFVLADYPTFICSYLSLPSSSRRIDAVFLSPPWGGPAYIEGDPTAKSDGAHPEYNLSFITPLPGRELFDLSRQVTPNVAFYLPKNVNLKEVSALIDGSPEGEMVEVEEEWMGTRLSALTCYFGGLAAGQERLFDS